MHMNLCNEYFAAISSIYKNRVKHGGSSEETVLWSSKVNLAHYRPKNFSTRRFFSQSKKSVEGDKYVEGDGSCCCRTGIWLRFTRINNIPINLNRAVNLILQGNYVRKLKGMGVDKCEWMPHVNVLKDMKKQLEEMKKSGENNLSDENSNPELKNGSVDSGKEDEILMLEDAIQKQVDNRWYSTFENAFNVGTSFLLIYIFYCRVIKFEK